MSVNNLIKQKHELMRNSEHITKEEYDTKLAELNEQISSKSKELLDNAATEKIEKESEVKINMAEEEQPKPKGKKPKADSYTMIIVKTLMQKGIKTMDVAVEKVLEEKPGREKAKGD